MNLTSLKNLYIDQLKDLFSAEQQLTKALPRMSKAASSPELKKAFDGHLGETEHQIDRLNQMFERLGTKPGGMECKAMQGLIKEGEDFIKEKNADPNVLDAALIAAAQRIEHYEIGGYGTARAFAEVLGEQEAAEMLQKTLDEEGNADKKLTKIAGTINPSASRANDGESRLSARDSARDEDEELDEMEEEEDESDISGKPFLTGRAKKSNGS